MLQSYRLVFNKVSKDGSGKANIEQHELSHVWGVLYSISDADLRTLDRGEGDGYRRISMPVRIKDAETVNAWIYVASGQKNDAALQPYTWYKRFLLEGAREHALPSGYIAQLEGLEATADSDESRDRAKRALLCTSKE